MAAYWLHGRLNVHIQLSWRSTLANLVTALPRGKRWLAWRGPEHLQWLSMCNQVDCIANVIGEGSAEIDSYLPSILAHMFMLWNTYP